MKKIIKLNESDLLKIVQRVINEQDETQDMGSDKIDLKLLTDYFTKKNGFEYVGNKGGIEVYQLKKGGYRLIAGIKPSDEPFYVDLYVFVGFPMGETISYMREVKGAPFMKVRMDDYGKILKVLQGASDFGKSKTDYDNLEPLPKF